MEKRYSSVHYNEYLKLDDILNSQNLKSESLGKPAHDEMLFIIIHQVYELWFKEIIHDLKGVMAILDRDKVDDSKIGNAVMLLNRIIEIEKILIDQIRVLETMTPLDFLDFRNFLIPASGFQSYQFRVVEIMLGLDSSRRMTYGNHDYKSTFNESQQQELLNLEKQSSLFDALERWLERTPFVEMGDFKFEEKYVEAVEKMCEREANAIHQTDYISEKEKELRISMLNQQMEGISRALDRNEHNKMKQEGSVRLSYDASRAALLINLYRDMPMLNMPYNFLAKLVEMDELLTMWRYRHSQMVMRMLGRKMGTGGSSGHEYLKQTALNHQIFSDFHNISTLMIPRSELPVLPEDIVSKLKFGYQLGE